jgi:hypothetical protein
MYRQMTQSNKDIMNDRGIELAFNREPYLVINFSLAAIIILIFVYAAVFSPDRNDYPVVCIHEKLTGEAMCIMRPFSQFLAYSKGRISEAFDWNPYGLRVFCFSFFNLS